MFFVSPAVYISQGHGQCGFQQWDISAGQTHHSVSYASLSIIRLTQYHTPHSVYRCTLYCRILNSWLIVVWYYSYTGVNNSTCRFAYLYFNSPPPAPPPPPPPPISFIVVIILIIDPPPLYWFITIQNKDLLTAAEKGDVQSVQRLIVGGANVNCKGEVIKWSILHVHMSNPINYILVIWFTRQKILSLGILRPNRSGTSTEINQHICT